MKVFMFLALRSSHNGLHEVLLSRLIWGKFKLKAINFKLTNTFRVLRANKTPESIFL